MKLSNYKLNTCPLSEYWFRYVDFFHGIVENSYFVQLADCKISDQMIGWALELAVFSSTHEIQFRSIL